MSVQRMKAIIDANIILGVGVLTSKEKSEFINQPRHSSSKVKIVPMFTITPAPKKGK